MTRERRRDNQPWLLDWMVKTTGRVQNFAYNQRSLPPEVKSYRMIPRVLEKYARHAEEMARAAEEHGHVKKARKLYWRAAELYREGQHAIFQDDNPEMCGKGTLPVSSILACSALAAAGSPYPEEAPASRGGP